MIQHSITVELARGVGEVFRFVDDDRNTPNWLERCVSCERLASGPKKVGDELRYRYRDGSKEKQMDGQVTAYQPNRRLAMAYSDDECDVAIEFDFLELAQSTQLHHSITIVPKRFVVKLMTPVIRMAVRRQTAKDMDRLKVLIESSVEDQSAAAAS